MNKKKKKTRIKHRKNQNRVKKIFQISLLKAKPKKASSPVKVETELLEKPIIKKTPTKKEAANKKTAKKSAAKKSTTKKSTAKKSTAKKSTK